ncbi:MAG: multicopper oxidase domain-containing protein, partial [Gemmatimonadota bacterium]
MPTRRELLFGAAGAAGAAGALALAAAARGTRDAFRAANAGPRGADPLAHGPYGHGVEPPTSLGPAALDAATIPPPPVRGPVTRDLTITQRPVAVAQGATLDAWTFEGTIPGPTLRVTEGETLTLRVRNLTGHPHNLHTHGAHAPES